MMNLIINGVNELDSPLFWVYAQLIDMVFFVYMPVGPYDTTLEVFVYATGTLSCMQMYAFGLERISNYILSWFEIW